MSKILRNITASPISIADVGGVTIASGASYTIPPQNYLLFAASSNTVTYIGAGSLVVNDGSVDLNISDGIDLIKGLYPRDFVFTPTIARPQTHATPNTESSYVFPVGTRRILIINEGSATIKLAFTSGQSGTLYVGIIGYGFYSEGRIAAPSLTAYFQAPSASQQLAILSWS